MENNNPGNRKSLGDYDRLETQKGVTEKDKYRLLSEIYHQTDGEGIGGEKKNIFQKIAEEISKGKK